jgi:tetratricopeptide (TPR) repeat protein
MPNNYYIRRDDSALASGLFFGRRRKRRFRWVLPMLLISMIIGSLFYWQRDTVQPIVLGLVGIRNTPTLTTLEAARQAELAFWRGDLNTAVEQYRHAVTYDPDDIGLSYEYVRMLLYRSFTNSQANADFSEAKVQLDYLAERAPNDPRVLTLQCFWLLRTSQTEVAAQSCNRALNFNPNSGDAWAYLTQAYYEMGRYEEAAEAGRKALAISPNSIDANTAYGFLQLTARQPENAIQYFIKAAEYNKRLEFPYFNLALNAFGVGLRRNDPEMFRLAINAYDTVLAMNKRSVKAYTGLCQLYFVIGERNLARDNCVTATDLDETYTPAWRWLGEINYITTEYEQAIVAFEACAKHEQPLPTTDRQLECWVFRGLSYVQTGNCLRAMPIFTDVLGWVRSPTQIERVNKGIRVCTGRSLPTPTPPAGG